MASRLCTPGSNHLVMSSESLNPHSPHLYEKGFFTEIGTNRIYVHLLYVYVYVCIYIYILCICICVCVCVCVCVYMWGFSGGMAVKNPPAMQETRVGPLGREDPLEEGMATHSSILAWRIPWTEEPGGLQAPQGCKELDMTEVTEHAHVYMHI